MKDFCECEMVRFMKMYVSISTRTEASLREIIGLRVIFKQKTLHINNFFSPKNAKHFYVLLQWQICV